MTTGPHLSIRDIAKGFGPTDVLGGISIDVAAGEFLAVIGPSGCGKSTLLRVISGLEQADAGRVVLSGRDVTELRAAERDVAMVFQSYALYPHLTARQNMAVPLAMRRLSAAQRLPVLGRLFGSRAIARSIAADVETAAAALKIVPLLDRKPSQMSGGQRQRVALGRAIVRHPQLFLMDEPLSNLDVALRVHMREEIVQLHRRLGTTTVYVTHDQAEALSMADRIAVMMGGRLLQVAAPSVLYGDPDHLDVAEFAGTPKINVIAAEIDGEGVAGRDGTPLAAGFERRARAIRLAVRPESIEIVTADRAGALAARVARIEFQGAELLAHMTLASSGEAVIARLAPGRPAAGPGQVVGLHVVAGNWLAFGSGGERLRPDAVAIRATPQPVYAHG